MTYNIISNPRPDMTIVSWSLTSTCNFSCRFCPTHLHDGKYRWPDYDKALSFFKQLMTRGPLYIELLGGEPTLWPQLVEFTKELAALGDIVIQIGTNGGKSISWWEDFITNGLENNVIFHFSFHPAMADPDSFFDKIKLTSETHNVSVGIMLDPDHHDKTIRLLNKITSSELHLDYIFKGYRPNFDPSKYIDGYSLEMLELLKVKSFGIEQFQKRHNDKVTYPSNIYIDGTKVNVNDMLLSKTNSFDGWSCSAGSQRLHIEIDGNVSVCGQYAGDPVGYLGNIYNKVKLLDLPIKCGKSHCGCKQDIMAPKVRIDKT